MRIVSLIPSATEILFAFGIGEEICGVSHECDFPPEARAKRVVVHPRIPEGLPAAEIERRVREYVSRGESLYVVDAAALAELDPDQSRLVELRFFGGLSVEETAEVLGVSTATVKRSWSSARAFLHRQMAGRADEASAAGAFGMNQE